MRVTGCADPRADVADTLEGKLPQRKITMTAAEGYSSYGNQVGVPAGHVREIYHPGYMAKRMELGAVVAAAPRDSVRREIPGEGDVVILLGGRTGRDGIGGATGSSKNQDVNSLAECGAEVQKGDPVMGRKLLRLFRKPRVTALIKKCNDFGAGGVSVAVGELAPGLDIDLDAVPLKYDGLDGTEIAISESQERMAVVVAGTDAAYFIALAAEENLEATVIARVNESGRLVMQWRGEVICDVSRDFLDSNGAGHKTAASINAPDINRVGEYVAFISADTRKTIAAKNDWLTNLARLDVCSQEGLIGMFDFSAGGNTVLMPLGGKLQRTPVEGMAAKIPVPGGTTTATLMAYGFDPYLSSESPYHGGLYAVVESLAKLAAMGGDVDKARLSFQEFYEKPGEAPDRWGKPLAALLGALRAQLGFGSASVGGKDSMSGTFGDIDVPPTLVSFAITPSDTHEIISPEFKLGGNNVALLAAMPDVRYPGALLPDLALLKKTYMGLYKAIRDEKVISAYSVRGGGVAAAISMMCFGNNIGFEMDAPEMPLYMPMYGSIIIELAEGVNACDISGAPVDGLIPEGSVIPIGRTISTPYIYAGGSAITLDEAFAAWGSTLEEVFPVGSTAAKASGSAHMESNVEIRASVSTAQTNVANTKTNTEKAGTGLGAEPGTVLDTGPGTGHGTGPGAGHGTGPGAGHGRIPHIAVKKASPRALLIAAPGTNGEYDASYALEKAGVTPEVIVIKNRTASALRESAAAVEKAIRQAEIFVLPGGYCNGSEPDSSGTFMAAFLRDGRIAEALTYFHEVKGGLTLGMSGGFQALLKLGLLPFGKITEMPPPGVGQEKPGYIIPANTDTALYNDAQADFTQEAPALLKNASSRFISRAADVVVCENCSPWLSFAQIGDIFTIPAAHGGGNFHASKCVLETMISCRQIATRYAGLDGKPAVTAAYNPGGSVYAVEGVTSPDGRIFGKMAYAERCGEGALKNIYGNKNFDIFQSGAGYFL